MTAYQHLALDVQPLADLPKQERIRIIDADRFIRHDRLKPVIEHARALVCAPQRSRAAGLCVFGPPGSGKTMLGRSIIRLFEPSAPTETTARTRPVVMINMTGARDATVLFNRLLDALDTPSSARNTRADRESQALRLCQSAGVKLLIVDEIQDILNTTLRQQRIALDTVKLLMNSLRIPILALGTKKAKTAIMVDEHLAARMKFRELTPWKADAYLGRFLEALELRLPLQQRSRLSTPDLMVMLVRHAQGSLHEIVRLVRDAAVYGVQAGDERVTKAHIEAAVEAPPPVWVDPDAVPPSPTNLPVAA